MFAKSFALSLIPGIILQVDSEWDSSDDIVEVVMPPTSPQREQVGKPDPSGESQAGIPVKRKAVQQEFEEYVRMPFSESESHFSSFFIWHICSLRRI